MSKLHRVAEIVLPILRGHNVLTDQVAQGPLAATWPGLVVGTWGEDVDYRRYPRINIRRIGGARNPKHPTLLSGPVIEMTAYVKAPEAGEPECEQLYEDALEVLYAAKRKQLQTPYGYLHSINENLGLTQFSSLYQDSWRVQGLIKLGIRPPRSA